jgi:hypothetical protein
MSAGLARQGFEVGKYYLNACLLDLSDGRHAGPHPDTLKFVTS